MNKIQNFKIQKIQREASYSKFYIKYKKLR